MKVEHYLQNELEESVGSFAKFCRELAADEIKLYNAREAERLQKEANDKAAELEA